MALAEADVKNRPKTPFVGREMEGLRRLKMPSKVSNRTETFVDVEGVRGTVEVLFAPFVSNRNAGCTADFDDFKASSARVEGSGASTKRRKAEWGKIMRVCEAP